jgi:hypothetical protein
MSNNNSFSSADMKVEIGLKNKFIQDVIVGDFVTSFDIETNRFRTNRVQETFLPIVEKERQHKIITDDGSTLVTSDIHPMCYLNTSLNRFDYKHTQDVIVGDLVKGFNFLQKVEDVLVGSDINEDIDEQFYDINVANDNNYLAGDSDDISKQIVIHNSSTVYFPFWTKEIQDILVLKNNKGASENRVRGVDFGIQFCRLFYKRVVENKNITLFSPNDVKDLYEAFGYNDIFEPLYLKYEKDKSIKKITIKARDLMEQFILERFQTGRMYVMNIDHANTHSSFLEKVEMSNLCLDKDSMIDVRIYDLDAVMANKYGFSISDLAKNFIETKMTIEKLDELFADLYIDSKKVDDKLLLISKGLIKVGSYNFDTNEVEFNNLLKAVCTNESADVLRITDVETGKSIVCTNDHLIFTENRGYITAGELDEKDVLKIK